MKKIIVGAIFVGALLLAGHRLVSFFGSDDNTYESAGKITSLEINDKNTNVEITATDEDEPYISITYTEGRNYEYSIEEQDGVLVMTKKNKGLRLPFSFGSRSGGDVYIEISEPALKHLNVTTTNGEINLDGFALDDAQLDTTNDDINLTSMKFNKQLNGITTNGEVYLEDVTVHVGDLQTTNDSIYLEDTSITRSLSAETTNADIEGTINDPKKDFSISSSTTNGDNDLGNSSDNGKKKLDVMTTNGDISFDFGG